MQNEHYIPKLTPSEMMKSDKRSGDDADAFWYNTIQNFYKWRDDKTLNNHGPKQWAMDYLQYKGFDPLAPDADLIVVNETGSAVNVFVALLLANNPYVYCNPRNADSVISVMLQEEVVNYDWKEYDIMDPFKKACYDAAICGTGALRIGYVFPEDKAAKSVRSGFLGTKDCMRVGAPYARRIRPEDLIIDPDAPDHDPESARFAGETYWVPAYEIIESADTRLNSDVVKKIRDGYGRGQWGPETKTRIRSRAELLKAEKNDRIHIAEIWDKRYRNWMKFVPGIKQPLMRTPWPYMKDGESYLDGLPIITIPFIYNPDSHYHFGVCRWIRHLQHELNRSRTQMFNYRRRVTNIMYTLIKNGLVSDKELDKLEDPDMGEYILAKVHDVMKAVEVPTLSPDIYNIESKIMMDIERILGLDELTRSGRLPSRTSATEVNERGALLAVKTSPLKTNFDKAAAKVARQILQHEKAWAPKERVIRIAGRLGEYWGKLDQEGRANSGIKQSGEYLFATFTAEEIQAEYDMEVQTMSMADGSPEAIQAMARELYNTTLTSLPVFAEMYGEVPDMRRMLSDLFKKMGRHDAIRFLPWDQITEAPKQQITEQEAAGAAPTTGGAMLQNSVNPASTQQGGNGGL